MPRWTSGFASSRTTWRTAPSSTLKRPSTSVCSKSSIQWWMRASPTRWPPGRPRTTPKPSRPSPRSASRNSAANRRNIMEFFVSDHIVELRNIVQRFLDKEVPPATVAKWDKTNSIPLDFQRRFADLGLTLVTVPEEFGGMGSDVVALVTIIEMLATRSLALSGLYIMSACYGALNIAASGSDEQKRRFLPDIAAGKLIFAYGLSEPDVGADLASVTTRIERKGDRVVINGMKRWTSGGGIADYVFVLARSGEPGARHKNLTFVLVPPSAPGVTL